MRSLYFGLVSVGALGALLIPACGPSGINIDVPAFDGGEAGLNNPDALPSARGVGERCDDGGVCRPGLACNATGVCEPGRSSDTGAQCVISAECKDGLYCGPERTCAAAGAGESGATCGSDGDCKSGLRCNIVGLDAQCQPEGTKDVNNPCATASECFAGLLCADPGTGAKICVPPPPGGIPPLAIPGFKGVECEVEPAGPVTAYFRVPRGNADDKDFFRLPFPNDVRRKNGKPDYTKFPTPGSDLLGFDLVDRWARYTELNTTGFSAYPTITFRFSGEMDFESLKVSGATKMVDISPGEGNDIGHNWAATTGRTQYVCPNGVSFRPPAGVPLKPGHTYAAIMTNAAKAKDGSAVVVAPDLTALLGASDPGGELSAAYAAYAPLRTWAASKSFNLQSIVNVSVFTVGTHDDIAKKTAAAVAALPAPTASAWVKCAPGVVSPCAQAADTRACPATPDPAFDELHALITLPGFQQGTSPFTEPTDGGDFVLDGSGNPTKQSDIQVCAALTVPAVPTPAGGFPIVIYAHGTGGSFRSHINEGVAARLANVEGTAIAVLGIDQVGHGTRRGASTAQPQTIFFNFSNPAAARGNVLQGAADQSALVKFAQTHDIAAGSSPIGKQIKFGKIAFWGHSQGATEGSISMPYTEGVTGVLFSGVGGSIIDSLLTKKSPVNLAALAPAVLSESPANVNSVHPALALFQNGIDAADPLDHAAAVTSATGNFAKHVFVPYGQNDTFSPPSTQFNYVVAANLAVAQHPTTVTTPDNLIKAAQPVPLGNNNAGKTAVVRQYAQPAGSDGHFVVFRDTDAKLNADRFLVDSLKEVTPLIGR